MVMGKKKRTMPILDVRSIRLAAHLTQEELAKRLGVCQASITHWETGKRSPGGPVRILLEQLAGAQKKTG
jgi:DNA-binding transcriptional regulator YiaG